MGVFLVSIKESNNVQEPWVNARVIRATPITNVAYATMTGPSPPTKKRKKMDSRRANRRPECVGGSSHYPNSFQFCTVI